MLSRDYLLNTKVVVPGEIAAQFPKAHHFRMGIRYSRSERGGEYQGGKFDKKTKRGPTPSCIS